MRIGFSIAKDGWECEFQEAGRTPMKSQLDFKDVVFVGSNVSIAACPIRGMSFTIGTVGNKQTTIVWFPVLQKSNLLFAT